MADHNPAYLPPKDGFYKPPLDRYLPPLPKAAVSIWLDENTSPGDLVIDPLGANPMLALEAAKSGRKILSACNNPVLQLMLEMLASAPTIKEIEAAVSKLLLSRQANITLEEQLRSIYVSTCFDCGESIQPQGYIWEENADAPILKVYRCPACGADGEKPVSEEDIIALRRLGNTGLQRARAFQRAAIGDDYERESIEDALNCYSPRAIFTLMLLVNRLDRLTLDEDEHRLLQAVLLSVFDDGNSLWHWPVRDHRYLQLSVPSLFLEKNLFLSLESAAQRWQSPFEKTKVTYYPDLPDSNSGICLYQRRLAEQEDFLSGRTVRAAIMMAPRPNQAFWTLSALWAGWLWGQKGSAAMRGALARRRYDWFWFAQAIAATMKAIILKLEVGARLLTFFPEATPNFYLGLSCGMRAAGAEMDGYAYRPSEEIVQILSTAGAKEDPGTAPDIRSLVKNYMDARGEPAFFNELLMYVISTYLIRRAVSNEIEEINDGLFRQIQENLATLLRDEHFTIIYKTNQPGGSRHWLVDTRNAQQPLAERVEQFIVEYLHKSETIEPYEIELQACRAFKGILTPSAELISSIMVSYTDLSERTDGKIQLRDEENKEARESDLKEVNSLLMKIGKSFGFEVTEPDLGTILWQDSQGKSKFKFFLKSVYDISELVMKSNDEGKITQVIVLPGSRSRLIAYRMREDLRLAGALEENWHFLKFRHLRRLAARENLTLAIWENLLDSDPMLWEATEQMPLL